MRTLKITILIVLVCLFLVTTWASISMAGSGFSYAYTIVPNPSPNGTTLPCPSPYSAAFMGVSYLPDTDDEGSGYDWTAAVARRPNGDVLSVGYHYDYILTNRTTRYFHYTFGTTSFTGTAWLEVYDITYAATYGPAPVSEFSRIRASAPTPAIRIVFNTADYLAPGCVTDTSAAGDISAPLPPDERLNWQQGDLMAVVYAASDSSGAPAMHVYTVNDDSRGTFLASVTQADIAPYRDTPSPAANTVIKTLGENVTLYRLVSGEFALVIGPDKEGKNWQIIFDDIPWTYLKHEDFDPGHE